MAWREVSEGHELPGQQISLNTEPSFYKAITRQPSRAFVAWTRGRYYFSAWVPGAKGEEVLDRFMGAFPY